MAEFVNVGMFGGEEVRFYPIANVLECKNVRVFYHTFERFLDSGKIRANLDSETSIVKKENTYKIGCLEDTHLAFNKIRKKIKELLTNTK